MLDAPVGNGRDLAKVEGAPLNLRREQAYLPFGNARLEVTSSILIGISLLEVVTEMMSGRNDPPATERAAAKNARTK